MLLAASEGLKNISSVVGGNVTLPDPVPEEGFLVQKLTILAQVFEKKLRTYEGNNRILWDQTSGLFTITELQKSDSGVYNIDSKRGKVFTASYNLTVYDPAAPPAVWRLNSSSDSCWLLCSVDRLSSLSWFRGQQQLDRRDSVLSLRVSISREELNSSFRCESSNPADESSVDVDVETFCSQVTPGSEESSRLKWAAVAVAIATSGVIVALVVCLIRKKKVHRNSRIATRRDLSSDGSVQYTAIQFQDRSVQGTSSDMQEASHLGTVYDLQSHRMAPTDATDLTTVYSQPQKHATDPTDATDLTTVYSQPQKHATDPTGATDLTTVYSQPQKHATDPTGATDLTTVYSQPQKHATDPTGATDLTTVYSQPQKHATDPTGAAE
ncbi:hypothetical protein OJAV_G00011930 [Oryzias javanicus]|uniref:Ig-like domain-containing protein n=1 Tax=Oryzias javanicus TaxID=123683 RepID=A0A3S2Q299_ORYJA|nr:hypothetical protein OJAV_G00011930 [Oryzias javanicus]